MRIADHIKLPSKLTVYKTISLRMRDDIIPMFQSGTFPNCMVTYDDMSPMVRKYKILEDCLKLHNGQFDHSRDRIQFNNREGIVCFLNNLISQGIMIIEGDNQVQKFV